MTFVLVVAQFSLRTGLWLADATDDQAAYPLLEEAHRIVKELRASRRVS